MRFKPVLFAGVAAWLAVGGVWAQPAGPERRGPGSRPVFFTEEAPQDAITRLVPRIAAGEVAFAGAEQTILRTVLRELDIPVQSQVLVFSRTSLQADIIRPRNPRALYFSDSAYVGWVPEGLIEVTVIDPKLGPIFYVFDPVAARERRGNFVRDVSCVGCHGGASTDGNPGLLFAHSLYTSISGEPLRRTEEGIMMTEQTPFAHRWGGWYVTGYTGTVPHRGNVISRERDGQIESSADEARPMELSRYFEVARYPTATSDVVALLIFEHQLGVHNALALAAHRTRQIMAQAPGVPAEILQGLIAGQAQEVLDRLLFREAAPLPEGVEGNSSYRRVFARGAKRDAQGHSLKDLSLQGRLFANRCSFLIHTEAFTSLPAPLKDLILDRLLAALRDTDAQGRYAYLETEEKRRILAILMETHPDAQRRWAGR